MPKKPYTLTRFGCTACKQRKIRCDEQRPICGNCARASRKYQRTIPCVSSSSENIATFTAPLSLFHFGPLRERHIRHDEVVYLDAFRNKLIEGIAGKSSRPAWRNLILQGVHDESALCHVAVAYGALNHVLSPSPTPGQTRRTNMDMVFRHYNKGISDMQRILDRKDDGCINTVLLCALLCICFEIRSRHPHTTLVHLQHALKIIADDPSKVDDDIALAFARLDILAAVSLRHHTPIMDIDHFANIGNNGTDLHWMSEHEFTVLLGRLCLFIRTDVDHIRFGSTHKTMPLQIIATAQRFQKKLYRFRQVYLGHILPDAKASQQMTPKRRLLWLKYLSAIILLRPCFSMKEEAFDDLLLEFSSIVSLSETITLSKDQDPSERDQLILDMGLIHPLFKVATKCRSPRVRRRAIELLGAVANLEAGWDAPAYKAYAERTMQREEDGLELDSADLDSLGPSVICESRRIHVLEIWPTREGCSTVAFRKRLEGSDTGWCDVIETVTW